jgi:hypothetical protein
VTRLDRTGEPLDEDEHAQRCRGGWLGFDAELRPIPCLACRPHLIKTLHSNDCAERLPSAYVARNQHQSED